MFCVHGVVGFIALLDAPSGVSFKSIKLKVLKLKISRKRRIVEDQLYPRNLKKNQV